MAVKRFDSLVGTNPGIALGIDLDFLETRVATSVHYISNTAIDCSAGLTTLLSLTGKFEILFLGIAAINVNDVDQLQLIIDGVTIMDEDGMTVNATTIYPWGPIDLDNGKILFGCDSSLTFKCETTADTSITFEYSVRPVL